MKLGLISKVKNLIGKLKPSVGNGEGGFIYNALKPFRKLVPEGEALHPANMFGKINFNYCGAYNRLDDDYSVGGPRKPLSRIDNVCRTHDFSYTKAHETNNKEEMKRLEREADLQMLTDLNQIEPQGIGEMISKGTAYGAISLKMGLENIGSKLIGQF